MTHVKILNENDIKLAIKFWLKEVHKLQMKGITGSCCIYQDVGDPPLSKTTMARVEVEE